MKKQRRKYDEVNYWESMADSILGLLLWILLIAVLLIMYLVRVPEENYKDLEQGNSYEKYDDADDGGGNHAYGELDNELGNEWEESAAVWDTEEERNDSGSYGYGDKLQDNLYDDPDPGAGEGQGKDKSAVFVQVLDGETQRAIKKKGLVFELYGTNSALKVLRTYYPQMVEYKKFETDETGGFYLPETIPLSEYYLHCLTNLKGYDTATNTEFSIDRSYDWEDPYVVTVALYPSKNSVRIQLKDKNDGKKLTGASFEIIAAENVVTQDGTTRYKEGEVVDQVVVDGNGYGESKELFLGNYLIRQKSSPEHYAKITSDTSVKVEGKTGVGTPDITEILEEKTKIQVTVKDALYDTQVISGAKFRLTEGSGSMTKELQTDSNGKFTVSDLKKNKTYHIQQISSGENYKLDERDYSFTVNQDGLIDGKQEADLLIKNRIIRIAIGVQDKIFRGQISDVNVALIDMEGTVIKVWNTTALEQTIEGIAPGEYRIVFNGNQNEGHIIEVQDKTELQEYQYSRWTIADIGTIVAMSLSVIGIVAFLIVTRKGNRAGK